MMIMAQTLIISIGISLYEINKRRNVGADGVLRV
jgi:hypothetical protein